jgi:arylsulfatase A-like enzyme
MVFKIILLIFVTGLFACSSNSVSGEATALPQRNILFIAIDDLRTDSYTPNIDRFAEEGVSFSRHYVQVPTCGSSRYALLTGRSPYFSKAVSNMCMSTGPSALKQEEQEGAQSFPELFKRSGYKTVCIGKISHNADGRVYSYAGDGDGHMEVPNAWDELSTPLGSWKRGWGIFFAYANGYNRESRDGMAKKDLMEFVAEKDTDLPDGLLAEEAIKQLKSFKKSKEPFLLAVGFIKPHLPFVATKGDWQAVQKMKVSLPEAALKGPTKYWHKSSEFYNYSFPFEKKNPLSKEATIKARRAYLACSRYVDRQVNKVLVTLKELGLDKNTIVVIWGDHGWHLGDQQVWAKHTPFERALRSPLIMRGPGIKALGKSDVLVETIDIYPTLVELCQPSFKKTSAKLDGQSLKNFLAGKTKITREFAVSYWKKDVVSIRSESHRLIYKKKQKSLELYDLSENLDQQKNIAADNPALIKKMLRAVPK